MKEYTYYKTAKKTAKENNLYFDEKEKRLFDIESLLNVLNELDIEEDVKKDIYNRIQSDIIKQLFLTDTYLFIHVDKWYCVNISMNFDVIHIYNKNNGNLLYKIATIKNIILNYGERSSIYGDEYNRNNINIKKGRFTPYQRIDIEI